MQKFLGYGLLLILFVIIIVLFPKHSNVPLMNLEYTIEGNSEKVTVKPGTTSWSDMFNSFEADASHPLDSVGYMPEIKKTDNLKEIKISFTSKPTSYTVRYWNDSYIGKSEAYDNYFETLKPSDDSITLPNDEQGYIYEIYATWSKGNAHYAFYITNDK